MVLSNKKLKQKLRSLTSESLAVTESQASYKGGGGGCDADVNQQLQDLRELRATKSQKPKSQKRPIRKKKPSLPQDPVPGEGTGDAGKENAGDANTAVLSEKKKGKKRKREGDGAQDLTPKKQKDKKLKLKKKKQKDKKLKLKKENSKDKKEDKNSEKGSEGVNEERNKKAVIESVPADGESEYDPKKVYVGGIPYYSTEDDIRSFFEKCGTITEMDCMRFPETGKFRGIAMLTFKTEAATQRALALDGEDMGGFYLKIQPYKSPRAQTSDFSPEMVDGYNKIYAGNLSWDITEDDLKKLFSECKISSIRFGNDKETGEFKGYAHVSFSDSASLTAALKLDQEMVCGRPVRIRCAVTKKGTGTNSTLKSSLNKVEDGPIAGSSKRKRRDCFECGASGHLASACPRKRAAEMGSSKLTETNTSSNHVVENAEEEDDATVKKPKKKRRTCYVCGVPGHLSSDCPNKRAAEVGSSELTETNTSSKNVIEKAEEENNATVKKPKKKRRTCYVCGVPGHLSSDCPNKRAVEVGSSELTETNTSSNHVVENAEEEDDTTVKKPKKKRRTCYVCGVPGHLSADCPNKRAAEVGSSELTETNTSAKNIIEKAEEENNATVKKPKKKRQTCYECGASGHISSDCPNKKAIGNS